MAIHYTCDLCGNSIHVEHEVRYEVNIEVKAAFEVTESSGHDFSGNLQDEMNELLDMMEDMDREDVENGVYKSFRFDLCNECRKRYLKDPLLRAPFLRRLGFSEN